MSDWLCARDPCQGWLAGACSNRSPDSGLIPQVWKRAALQPFLHVLERSSKNRSTGSIHPKRANGPRTTCRHPPWKGMPHMSDTDNTYAMTARNARPTALGDLRFAGTIATGLVAGTLGLGAIAAAPGRLEGLAAGPDPGVRERARAARQARRRARRTSSPTARASAIRRAVAERLRSPSACPAAARSPAAPSSASAPVSAGRRPPRPTRRDDPRREPDPAPQLAEPAHAHDEGTGSGDYGAARRSRIRRRQRRRQRPGRLRGQAGRQPGRAPTAARS